MNTEKDENASHTTDISDQMLNFINKEGANSFPTITVLFNRIFLASDQYEWVKNSNIDITFPTLKEKDDVHWYKNADLYTNVKNSLDSLLNKCKIFQDEPISSADKISKFFSSKTKIYYVLNSVLYSKTSMGSVGIAIKSNDSENLIISSTIKDILTVDDYDFVLTNSNIYRINVSTNIGESVYSSSDMMNAFDNYEDSIVVATTAGGVVFSDVKNTFSKSGSIKYDTYIVAGPATGSDIAGDSGSTTISTTYTNNLPSDNNCTFVFFENGNTFSIGATSTSGKFTLGGSYSATMSDNKGLSVKGTNIHNNGINSVSTETGFKIGNNIFVTTNIVSSFYSDEQITLLVSTQGIEVYLNNKGGVRETVFTSDNNGIQGIANFIYKEDTNLYLNTSFGLFKTFDVESQDNPIVFILFSFVYDEDKSKDKIDMRQAKLSIPEIISLAYSEAVFNKYMQKSLEKNTNFIIAYGKTATEKVVYNLYGNDERRNLANEVKMCANAFDIGIG